MTKALWICLHLNFSLRKHICCFYFIFHHSFATSSTIPPHLGDVEDILWSAAVAHSLSHPAVYSRHVAEPTDCFISVVLDNRQDLIKLLFGDFQQLRNVIQLHVQFPNTGTLWSQEEDKVLSFKMSARINVQVEAGGCSPVSRAPWQFSHSLCSCQHSDVCLRRALHSFLFCRKRGRLSLSTTEFFIYFLVC